MTQTLVTLPQAANLIGKNLRTIQRYISNGKLTPHLKDGRNFIDREELSNKFQIRAETIMTGASNAAAPDQSRADVNRGTPNLAEANHYRDKWENEIQAHAKTREELGVWRGRAESYQNFATKLLASGDKNVSEASNHEKTPNGPNRDFWPQEPASQDNKDSIKPVIGYIVLTIVFIGFLILFYFISIKSGSG